MAELWQKTQVEDLRYVAAWAINSLAAVSREEIPFGTATPQLLAFVVGVRQLEGDAWQVKVQRSAALIVAYYLGSPYTDAELAAMFESGDHPGVTERHWAQIKERLPKAENKQVPLDLTEGLQAEDEVDDVEDEAVGDDDEVVIVDDEVIVEEDDAVSDGT